MDGAALPLLEPETLDELGVRLRERVAAIKPLAVVEILRAFLEVSTTPCAERLWSLEFAFDEDDGRIARIEARFAKHDLLDIDLDNLRGYEVQILLPKFIPPYASGEELAVQGVAAGQDSNPGSLAIRFLSALADLGAYRAIEALEAREATVFML